MRVRVSAVVGLAFAIVAMQPVLAQDATAPDMPGSEATEHDANGVFHGNYCGVGDNGPGLPPIDALDMACMHHDACTPSGGIPSCACNGRFRRETHAVAVSPTEPDDLKALATMVESAIPVIPCR